MTLSDVRPFLRERMLGLGFEEWKLTAFGQELIPDTHLEKAFHIHSPSGSGVSLNMHDQQIDFDQKLIIYRKGFNDPDQAVDTIIDDIEAILDDLLAPAQRLTGHLNVKLGGFTIEALNSDNDNSVKATLNLSVRVALGVT